MSFFSVQNHDIERQSPEGAVEIFRDLLWAEAARIGLGLDRINVPSAIDVPDGGIDAEVQAGPLQPGIIKPGHPRYQVKAGRFNPGTAGNIKKILFALNTETLKPRIQSCFDAGDTLTVVLFGWDNPEATDDALLRDYREVLTRVDPKYASAKIEFLTQNKLRGLFEQFPSLALRLNGNDGRFCQSHNSWAGNRDMMTTLQVGEEQERIVEQLREALRNNDAAVTVRILGEAGIGKTRLVHAAAGAPDLAPLVLYFHSARAFRQGDLMPRLVREDNHQCVLLVIDECDPDDLSFVWNHVGGRGRRIRLVTINNEIERPRSIRYFVVPPLADAEVQRILRTYGLPEDRTRRLSVLARKVAIDFGDREPPVFAG